MNHWRHNITIKLIVWLILSLMVINPALALQYQQLHQSTDFIGKIPDYLPRSYHIHISQKDTVLARLKQQGYDVIPASQEEARHFLASNSITDIALQLAANPDIEQPPRDECLKQTENCPPECTDDDFYNNYGCPETCKPTNKDTECKGKDCPQQQPPQNDCTDTDPVERARDIKPVPEPEADTDTSRPTPRTSGSISVHQGFKLPNISLGGGKKGDGAAVMLIIIGVVVIAALFVYAGKFIADLFSGDGEYYTYWWDIGTQFITLDTEASEQGNFTGLKFSGGFVANRLAQFGLAAEVGSMDLDLNYNRNSTPQRIQLEGTYWLIGPTVRWLLGYTDTEQLANNSYFYLELLGGSSDRNEVDKMAVARVGFNTGIGEHLRLGAHYGAFYLGLNEDQGFANDGDNYWDMYGLEIGYQF